MDKETKAEMITRNALKASYAFLETLDKRKELQLKIPTDSKCSLKNKLTLISKEVDLISEKRLIYKGVLHKKQRTSKHKTTRWVFLDNVDAIKIKHIEEKIFPIIEVRINSKKPFEPVEYKHAIFIERHFLDRMVQHIGIESINNILQTCSPFIMSLIQDEETCDDMLEKNKIIMLSEDAYVYAELKTFKGKFKEKYQCDKGYVLNTIIPKSIWSKRKSVLLTPLLSRIEITNSDPCNAGHKTILIFKPSTIEIEEKIEIMPKEIKTIIA